MPIIEPDFMELTSTLDVADFWKENQKCTIFTTDKPRCALSFSPDDHWVFGFESISSTIRYYRDKTYRDDLHRRVNENTAEYVGKTFFSEDTWETVPKRIENLFQCEFTYREGGTPWLVPATDSPEEFVEILDEAEKTDLRTWAIPADYRAEWDKRKNAGQKMPALGTGSRGPATIATSVIGPNQLFLQEKLLYFQQKLSEL